MSDASPSMPIVALVTGSLGPGGTEIAVYRTALGLARRGRYRPIVVVLAEAGSMGIELRQAGVEVLELRLQGRAYAPAGWLRLIGLARALRRRKIAIAHTFLFDADVFGLLAARVAGARAITTRRAIKRGRRWQLAAYRWTTPLADRVVANSEEVRRFTAAAERVAPEKLQVLPNGVDTAALGAGDGTRLRAELGLPSTTLLVGCLGTVKPVKGQDVLLEAMLPIVRERGDVVVALAGSADSAFARRLAAEAESAGCGPRVRFLGNRDDVRDVLAALDVFVLPSRSEGMSNALLEGMAAGRAIVATRVGGNAEALAEGACGRLVPPEDAGALRAAIGELLSDAAGRARLAAAALARARAEYDLRVMLDRTEGLYDEVLAEAGSAP